MASKNGTAPDKPQIEINGVKYDMRLWEELSWKDQLRIQKWGSRVQQLGETLQDYFDIDDDDDDEDDIPDELAEEYARVYTRIVRMGYPDVPKETWDNVPPARISAYGDQFIQRLQQDKQGNEETPETDELATRRGRKRSKKPSRV
jgi:hypothetical protein